MPIPSAIYDQRGGRGAGFHDGTRRSSGWVDCVGVRGLPIILVMVHTYIHVHTHNTQVSLVPNSQEKGGGRGIQHFPAKFVL